MNFHVFQMPEGSQVEVGELIAITMEKGSDWKTAVVPTAATKVAAAVAPTPSTPAPSKAAGAVPASSGASKPPPSGQ